MKHKHHIIPKHKGGTDDPSNLVELTVTVTHLQSFCEENNLSRNMLYSICKGIKKSHRDWIEVTKITLHHILS